MSWAGLVYSGFPHKDHPVNAVAIQKGTVTASDGTTKQCHINVYAFWNGSDPTLEIKENDPWQPYPPDVSGSIDQAGEADVVDIGRGYVFNKGAGFQYPKDNPHRIRWVRCCSICWLWNAGEVRDENYTPYEKEMQLILEEAFASDKPHADLTIAGQEYRVFFRRAPMAQVCLRDRSRMRHVRRIGPRVRGIRPVPYPEHWGGYDPSKFVYDPSSSFRSSPTEMSSSASEFVSLAADHEIFQWIQRLLNMCIATGAHRKKCGEVWAADPNGRQHPKSFRVKAVSLVKNRHLWLQYHDRRREMEELYKGQSLACDALAAAPLRTSGVSAAVPVNSAINECWLFHGAGPISEEQDAITLITSGEAFSESSLFLDMQAFSYGLSARFSSTEGMFGGGVYLADLSSKANLYVPCPTCFKGCYRGPNPQECPCKVAPSKPYRMLLCRALLGRIYTVPTPYNPTEMKVRNPLLRIEEGRYDSLLAEPGSMPLAFREIVVYDGAQVYPEFIVEYERSLENP